MAFLTAAFALVFRQFSRPLSLFYSGWMYLSLVYVFLVIPFAIRAFPRWSAAVLLTMAGIWVASKTPVGFPDGYGANWLDGPFVEMLLYIPLSMLAGLGISGLMSLISQQARFIRFSMIAVPLLIAASNPGRVARFYPDACCNYVTDADVKAIRWLDDHSPKDSVIWSAAFKPKKYMIGTDGGVWIFALTGRNVNKLDYDFDWHSEPARRKICQAGSEDVYIFRGGQSFSFDDQELAKTGWLKLVFMDDKTKIYWTSCSQ
jgi:uncharacterized membrane protein SirB2